MQLSPIRIRKNEMELSRKIRVGVGAAIILGGLLFQSSWWIIGLLPLITGIFNTCPTCNSSGGTACKVETTKENFDQN
jgi:hypothetical protein